MFNNFIDAHISSHVHTNKKNTAPRFFNFVCRKDTTYAYLRASTIAKKKGFYNKLLSVQNILVSLHHKT